MNYIKSHPNTVTILTIGFVIFLVSQFAHAFVPAAIIVGGFLSGYITRGGWMSGWMTGVCYVILKMIFFYYKVNSGAREVSFPLNVSSIVIVMIICGWIGGIVAKKFPYSKK